METGPRPDPLRATACSVVCRSGARGKRPAPRASNRFLSYLAGCTEKVWLGSMVVVLPWHDPIRVAEQVSMRDNLLCVWLLCVWNYRQEGPDIGQQNPRIPRFS